MFAKTPCLGRARTAFAVCAVAIAPFAYGGDAGVTSISADGCLDRAPPDSVGLGSWVRLCVCGIRPATGLGGRDRGEMGGEGASGARGAKGSVGRTSGAPGMYDTSRLGRGGLCNGADPLATIVARCTGCCTVRAPTSSSESDPLTLPSSAEFDALGARSSALVIASRGIGLRDCWTAIGPSAATSVGAARLAPSSDRPMIAACACGSILAGATAEASAPCAIRSPKMIVWTRLKTRRQMANDGARGSRERSDSEACRYQCVCAVSAGVRSADGRAEQRASTPRSAAG